MAEEVTVIKPTGLMYRVSTSYWQNYANVYDNDENTSNAGTGTVVRLNVDFSWVPANKVISKIKTTMVFYRNGNTNDIAHVAYGYGSSASGGDITAVYGFDFNLTSYQTKVRTSKTHLISEAQSDQLTGARYPFISFSSRDGSSSRLYELTIEVTTRDRYQPIFVGDTASSIYIGTTPVKETYIGNTKEF